MAVKEKNNTVVILGANGFVGSHLTEALADVSGIEVKAVDRYSRGASFVKKDNIKIVKADFFSDKVKLDEVINGANYVFHCFSITTPYVSDDNPYLDIDMIRKSVEVFEACAKANVKKIIFISSGGAVYGSSAEASDVTEKHLPMPVSPYGIGKLAIEHYLEYFKRKYGIDHVTYRLTNPYGPRQTFKKNQGVIPAFIHSIMNKEQLVVYGDGSASRDYIYIEDAVAMIKETFMQDNTRPVYNIGSGKQTSLREILETLSHLLHTEIDVHYKEQPKTFLQRTGVSMNNFLSEFTMPPLTDLKTGLARVLQSYEEQNNN